MKRQGLVAVTALISALLLPVTPANADPIDIEADSSSFTWLDGQVSDVTFDPSGRMWVWNTMYNPGLPHGLQTNVFTQGLDGNWTHAFRFRLKNHDPHNVTFSSDGRLFSLDSYHCVLRTAKLKASGKPKSVTKRKFRMSFCPYHVQPIDGRKVILISSDQIREYKWPISARSKPIRTVRYGLNDIDDLLVGSDGTVYFAIGDYVNQSVQVFLPTQSGDSSPERSFTIHGDYSPQDIRGMSFTPGGDLALKMGSSVAIFSASAQGVSQIPDTYYRFGDAPSLDRGDVAFNINSGLMVVTEYGHEMPVRVFFGPSCRLAERIC